MPRRLMSLMAAAALLSVSCKPGETPAGLRQPPKLVFTRTSYVLGRVEAGRQLTQTYTFRNTGGLDLSIDNVRTACSCTAAALPTRLIPPGGQGVVDVTFDTTHERGHTARTITVYSNDPVQPVTTLTLVADIDAAVAADPPQLYIGHVHRGQAASNTVRLVSAEVPAVGTVETTGTVLDASVSGAVSAGPSATLRVAIKPNAPLGRFKEAVLVHMHNTRQPLLRVPVVGIVDPDVAVSAGEKRQ